MDDFLGSPFGEDLSSWVLPPGNRPYEETIGLIRGIAGSGRLTDQELYGLAQHLNDTRDARHAWPGNLLFQHLGVMFTSGEVNESDFAQLGRVLDEIDRQCWQNADALPSEPSLPSAAIRVEELTLPVIDRVMDIAAEGSRNGYEVDLGRHSCSCPGWFGNRRSFSDGDLKLCCAHMAAAFSVAFAEGLAADSPRVLRDLMAERARRGRGIDPKSHWKLIKLRMRPYLVSYGSGEWSSIYAYDSETALQRYAYDRDGERWSFGVAPPGYQALVDYLGTIKSRVGVFT